MYSFQHPRPAIALIDNDGSSTKIHTKNISMITVVFQTAMDSEKFKNRLNRKPSFGKWKTTI